MNYLGEINKFQTWVAVHPELSAAARILWFALMHYNNGCGWKKEFSLSVSGLALTTGLSESTIYRARKQLCDSGRIAFSKGHYGQASVYRVIPFAANTYHNSSGEAESLTLTEKESRTCINEGQNNTYDGNGEQYNEHYNKPFSSRDNSQYGSSCVGQSNDRPVPYRQKYSQTNCQSNCQDDCQNEGTFDDIPKQNKNKQNDGKENLAKKEYPAELADEDGFMPPSLEMVRAYCLVRGNTVDPEQFVDYYQRRDWFVGQTKMKNWKAVVRSWERRKIVNTQTTPPKEQTSLLTGHTPPRKYVYINGGDGSYVDYQGGLVQVKDGQFIFK